MKNIYHCDFRINLKKTKQTKKNEKTASSCCIQMQNDCGIKQQPDTHSILEM